MIMGAYCNIFDYPQKTTSRHTAINPSMFMSLHTGNECYTQTSGATRLKLAFTKIQTIYLMVLLIND